MGRQLKRVSIDFDWPINKIWDGYLNPYSGEKCEKCDAGYNPETQKLHDEWYGYHHCEYVSNPYREGFRYNKYSWSNNLTQEDVNALVEAGRLMDLTHTFKAGEGWSKKVPKYFPTAEEVNEWNLKGMGHDSINCHVCVEARATRKGVYGFCKNCDGELITYHSKALENLCNNWKELDPPEGEGYQLWENTSEGSPKSPVFNSLENLCEWCEENATTFADFKSTKEEWAKMLGEDNVHYKNSELGVIFL